MATWSSVLTAIAVLVAAIIVSASAPADAAAPTSLQEAKDALEGVWLSGAPADKGDCRTNWYDGKTQLEFEFRKSGGRILFFEPYDLFTAVQITDVEKSGDTLTVRALARDGKIVPYMRIRLLDNDRIELTHDTGRQPDAGQPAEVDIAHRCGAPDRSVNQSVTTEDLSYLTPSSSGSVAYPQTVKGTSDKGVCEGKDYIERLRSGVNEGHIQFELLGPVHYWVFGIEYGETKGSQQVQEFDHVRSVRHVAPGVLKLTLQRPANYRQGWDVPGPDMPTYELTVISKGSRFEIPELSATFIRCNPALPGMHRWG